jgi:hypothetical protein
MSQTKAIKLQADDARLLAELALVGGISVSALVSEALAESVAGDLDLQVPPLPAGGTLIGPRLDDLIVAEAADEATAYGLTFSAYARAALGCYIARLTELGTTGESAANFDDGRRDARSGRFVIVSGCLHASRSTPDAAGFVDCEHCGRRARALPNDSPEAILAVKRELSSGAAPVSEGPVLLACGHLADLPLPRRCLRCGRRVVQGKRRQAA